MTRKTANTISATMTGNCRDQNLRFLVPLILAFELAEQFEKHSVEKQLEQLYPHFLSDFEVHSAVWYISAGQPLLHGMQTLEFDELHGALS